MFQSHLGRYLLDKVRWHLYQCAMATVPKLELNVKLEWEPREDGSLQFGLSVDKGTFPMHPVVWGKSLATLARYVMHVANTLPPGVRYNREYFEAHLIRTFEAEIVTPPPDETMTGK